MKDRHFKSDLTTQNGRNRRVSNSEFDRRCQRETCLKRLRNVDSAQSVSIHEVSLDELLEDLKTNAQNQLSVLLKLKALVSGTDPCLSEILSRGFVPYLVQLASSDEVQVRKNAFWILGNLSSASHDEIQEFLPFIDTLCQIVAAQNDEKLDSIKEDCCIILGNIGSDCFQCRDLLNSKGVLTPLLFCLDASIKARDEYHRKIMQLLGDMASIDTSVVDSFYEKQYMYGETANSAVWAIGCLIRDLSTLQISTLGLIPILIPLLKDASVKIVIEVCWIFVSFSAVDDFNISLFVTSEYCLARSVLEVLNGFIFSKPASMAETSSVSKKDVSVSFLEYIFVHRPSPSLEGTLSADQIAIAAPLLRLLGNLINVANHGVFEMNCEFKICESNRCLPMIWLTIRNLIPLAVGHNSLIKECCWVFSNILSLLRYLRNRSSSNDTSQRYLEILYSDEPFIRNLIVPLLMDQVISASYALKKEALFCLELLSSLKVFNEEYIDDRLINEFSRTLLDNEPDTQLSILRIVWNLTKRSRESAALFCEGDLLENIDNIQFVSNDEHVRELSRDITEYLYEVIEAMEAEC